MAPMVSKPKYANAPNRLEPAGVGGRWCGSEIRRKDRARVPASTSRARGRRPTQRSRRTPRTVRRAQSRMAVPTRIGPRKCGTGDRCATKQNRLGPLAGDGSELGVHHRLAEGVEHQTTHLASKSSSSRVVVAIIAFSSAMASTMSSYGRRNRSSCRSGPNWLSNRVHFGLAWPARSGHWPGSRR